jgi:hypothetical protein
MRPREKCGKRFGRRWRAGSPLLYRGMELSSVFSMIQRPFRPLQAFRQGMAVIRGTRAGPTTLVLCLCRKGSCHLSDTILCPHGGDVALPPGGRFRRVQPRSRCFAELGFSPVDACVSSCGSGNSPMRHGCISRGIRLSPKFELVFDRLGPKKEYHGTGGTGTCIEWFACIDDSRNAG